jgi:hypothetical protein
MIEPTSRDLRSVQRSDGSTPEQSGQDTTDPTADSVQSERIESLVDSDEELETGRKVTSDRGDRSDATIKERGLGQLRRLVRLRMMTAGLTRHWKPHRRNRQQA